MSSDDDWREDPREVFRPDPDAGPLDRRVMQLAADMAARGDQDAAHGVASSMAYLREAQRSDPVDTLDELREALTRVRDAADAILREMEGARNG